MTDAFRFGDLVIAVPGTSTGSDDEPLGLIAELRRSDCRVLRVVSGRSAWVPLAALRRAPGSLTRGTLQERIAGLLTLLGANELEFSTPEPGKHRLLVGHGALLPETVDRVREMLGADLRRYVIRPQGMHRIQSVLEFSFSPR
jgi:hypothetical protein